MKQTKYQQGCQYSFLSGAFYYQWSYLGIIIKFNQSIQMKKKKKNLFKIYDIFIANSYLFHKFIDLYNYFCIIDKFFNI